jgi:hypothetical protein
LGRQRKWVDKEKRKGEKRMSSATWQKISGKSPDKLRVCFNIFRERRFQVEVIVEGESFKIFVPESNAPFINKLVAEYGLKSEEIFDNGSNQVVHIANSQASALNQSAKKNDEKPSQFGEKKSPPKEELLKYVKIFTNNQIGEFYGVSAYWVKKWLNAIPEVKTIERGYTCREPGCNKVFTGEWAKTKFAAHMRNVHGHRKAKKGQAEEQTFLANKISVQEQDSLNSLRKKVSAFDVQIGILEKGKATRLADFDAQREVIVAEWDAKIAAFRKEKEDFQSLILISFTGEGGDING